MKDIAQALLDSPSVGRITDYQRAVLSLPQIDPPVEHVFAEGLYARPMYMKAGETVVGATHGKEHLCVVQGHCIVVDGVTRRELKGWNVFVSKPGAKRAIIAIADTVWMTVHATELTDVEAIEKAVLIPEDEPNRFFPHGTQETIERKIP